MADNREQVYRGAETAPDLYVNSVQFGATPYELRMQMGILEAADADKVVTRVSAKVFMSWAHVKVFSDLLSKNVASFEALNGPITLPETAVDKPKE